MKIRISKTYLSIFASLCMWMFATSNAYALACYIDDDPNAMAESVTLGAVAYLKGASNGDRIWESQTYTKNVTCESQLNSGEENLYVYPYPRRDSQQLPQGVKLGLYFDGKDLGLFDADGDALSSKVKTDHIFAKGEKRSITVTFKVYLEKQGEISTQGVTNLTLFQLDGVGSLRDSNYALSINGWDNIGSVSCDSSFVSNNAKLSSIDTDKALAGSASEESTVGSVKLSCSSESTTVLSHISHVSGTLKVNGSPFSGNSGYFATDKTGLGVGASYSGTSVAPGGTLDLSVPVSAGAGSKALTFTLNPHLTTSLALGTPDWLFTSQAQDIKSDMTLSFTPQSLQSD
ncbi:hypothetical protein Sant_3138 [Sodalis praecaptivus]|uniref:Fimbrial protein n=1 Tax=Sodalis praecaptivus TaxID=1239307 RepID=W0I040_9GAMM|nr:hypothetical protein [Sodalis praecaptivus]AHF78142.1 hypothetical protein Sant_3138 [Sodalis praecaptivus]